MSKRPLAVDIDAPSGSFTYLPSSSHAVDPRVVLSSIGEAVYDWDIATDALSWSGNAPALIGVEEAERLTTGAGFNRLLDPVSPATRAEAILLSETKDSGSGVPYRFSFVIRKTPGQSLWFEDSGRWFAGANGRAATAHGVVRRIEPPGEGNLRENPASNFDDLTGAYLRGPFIRLMSDDIEKAKEVSRSAVLFLVAINDLTSISQNYGFEAASEVIAGVARRLLGVLRRADRIVRYSNTKLGILLTVFDGDGDGVEDCTDGCPLPPDVTTAADGTKTEKPATCDTCTKGAPDLIKED
jgi:hypothetical protein